MSEIEKAYLRGVIAGFLGLASGLALDRLIFGSWVLGLWP